VRHDHAAVQVGWGDAGEVDGGSSSGRGDLYLLAVSLQAADSGANAGGQRLDLVADAQRAVHERAGDDGAEAGHRKRAVDRQAWPARVALAFSLCQFGLDGGEQVVEAGACDGGAADHRRTLQRRAAQHVRRVGDRQVESVGVDEVALGERDDAVGDAEQVDDRQVLARLRHHAFVGGDDEEREVDAADTGEHVLDEALVAGDVDDAHFVAARQPQPGETEVDRQAARLLLFPAVGVDAGEGLDERGLSVVDVSRSADDVHSCSILYRRFPL